MTSATITPADVANLAAEITNHVRRVEALARRLDGPERRWVDGYLDGVFVAFVKFRRKQLGVES